jgi:hypothetical protein
MKHLVLCTLFRADSYPLALAIGSCLYTYTPSQACDIVALSRDVPRYGRRRHLKQEILHKLHSRFQHVFTFTSSNTLVTEPPSAAQRQLVHEAMQALRPWDTSRWPDDDTRSGWERLDAVSDEWTRKHAILCKACAGFERFAQEWTLSADDQHNTPQHRLQLPVLRTHFPPAQDASLDDDLPLADDELEERLRRAREILRRDRQRRTNGRFSHLRVYIDGVESGRLALSDTATLHLPGVSSHAISVAVYGEDVAGLTPLALFDLSAVEDDDGPLAEPMLVVLDNDASITLRLQPQAGADGLSSWQLDLQWAMAAESAKDLAWCEAVLTTTTHYLALGRMFNHEAFENEIAAAVLPRLSEVYHIVCQASGEAAWQAELLTQLEALYRLQGEVGQTQACQQVRAALQRPALAPDPAATSAPPLWEQFRSWLSPLWQPLFAGEVVTAADVPPQEQTFYLEDGDIHLTCEWRTAYQQQPATLRLVWQANLSRPGELWVRFTPPDDPTVLRAEICLGTSLAGEETFTAQGLGFDPTREPWALMLEFREAQA